MPAGNGLRSGGFALGSWPKARPKSRSMNEKPENASAQPDLAAAIRQARIENAERAEAVADLREIELSRLALLEDALKSVVGQAPPGVDMFDLALTKGEHPRLFLDMIAFVDMAHDRRAYRFFQDTRHGRALIAESQSIDTIAAAVANYVARRLVERERALASEGPAAEASKAGGKQPSARPIASAPAGQSLSPPIDEEEAGEVAAETPAPRPRRFSERLGDALSLLLMLLGSITLALLICVGAYLAWTMRLRGLWAHFIGAPPF